MINYRNNKKTTLFCLLFLIIFKTSSDKEWSKVVDRTVIKIQKDDKQRLIKVRSLVCSKKK